MQRKRRTAKNRLRTFADCTGPTKIMGKSRSNGQPGASRGRLMVFKISIYQSDIVATIQGRVGSPQSHFETGLPDHGTCGKSAENDHESARGHRRCIGATEGLLEMQRKRRTGKNRLRTLADCCWSHKDHGQKSAERTARGIAMSADGLQNSHIICRHR